MITLNCGKCRKDTQVTMKDLSKPNIQCECGNFLIKDGKIALANHK